MAPGVLADIDTESMVRGTLWERKCCGEGSSKGKRVIKCKKFLDRVKEN